VPIALLHKHQRTENEKNFHAHKHFKMLYWIAPLILLYVLWKTVREFFLLWRSNINPSGKAVLVTGAASGIGKAVTTLLLEKNCFVFAADINEDSLQKLYG
jgi:NADPH:quinone reductase-like Zn-dependent oxidoreductase